MFSTTVLMSLLALVTSVLALPVDRKRIHSHGRRETSLLDISLSVERNRIHGRRDVSFLELALKEGRRRVHGRRDTNFLELALAAERKRIHGRGDGKDGVRQAVGNGGIAGIVVAIVVLIVGLSVFGHYRNKRLRAARLQQQQQQQNSALSMNEWREPTTESPTRQVAGGRNLDTKVQAGKTVSPPVYPSEKD